MSDVFKIISVIQSDIAVSGEPDVVFVTGLGSCVAACLFDPIAKVGGMNHFLLPYGSKDAQPGLQYGNYAMDALVQKLLGAGAQRKNLVCKVFGGASIIPRLGKIGDANIKFTFDYLQRVNIPCLSENVGGAQARRVRFWPATGRVQHGFIANNVEKRLIAEQEFTLSACSQMTEAP